MGLREIVSVLIQIVYCSGASACYQLRMIGWADSDLTCWPLLAAVLLVERPLQPLLMLRALPQRALPQRVLTLSLIHI